MLPPSCTGIQNSVKTENLTSPQATWTAHTSFWSKLEQTEYEKWLSLLGYEHIQGFLLSRLLEICTLLSMCLCVIVLFLCMHAKGGESLGGRTKTRTKTEHEERKRTQKVQNRGRAGKKRGK